MANIADAENAFLEGAADVEEWQMEFEREWFAPLGEMLAQTLVRSIPQQVLEQLPQDDVAAVLGKGGMR